MEAIDEFVTRHEACDILDVDDSRIEPMVEQGLLQPIDVDNEIMFSRAEVEALRLQGA